jgi:hypothetical protein
MDRRRVARLSTWAILALGGWLLVGAAPKAEASCGDYVHILPAGQPAADVDPAAPAPQKPCSGPGCREAPPAPMPAPPPAPTTTVQPHDAVLATLPSAAPPLGTWVFSETSLVLQRSATSIFHPPRA